LSVDILLSTETVQHSSIYKVLQFTGVYYGLLQNMKFCWPLIPLAYEE